MNSKALVVKSNKVVEASYRLSLAEQRILLACIAKIHSGKDLLADNHFEISVVEIADLAKLKNNEHVYQLLEETAEKLSKRQVIINDPDPDTPKTRKRTINWLSSVDYQPGEGKVIIEFSPKIMPYLSQLSRDFTRYKLQNVTQFKSSYSIRLYELLVQWLSTGKRDIEVEWLKNQLQIEECYSRIGNIKNRVVDVAVVEINQHSNIWVKYTQRKAGRTITHFLFTFGEKEPKKPTTTKPTSTKQLIPDFHGHRTYTVDSEAVMQEHKQLAKKPEPKPKTVMDSGMKAIITGLKRAVTHG